MLDGSNSVRIVEGHFKMERAKGTLDEVTVTYTGENAPVFGTSRTDKRLLVPEDRIW